VAKTKGKRARLKNELFAGSNPASPTNPPVEWRVDGARRGNLNIITVDPVQRLGGKSQFQVFDTQTGAILVEARTRKGAEAKLVRYLLRSRYRVMHHGTWVDPPPSTREMKVWVVRTDGKKELLTLDDPLTFKTVIDNYIVRSGHVDHFFTLDGKYNGWGTNTSNARANAIQKGRVIED
jgi:hypothetical protein